MTGERSTTLTITAEDFSQALKLDAWRQFKRPRHLLLAAAVIAFFYLLLVIQVIGGASMEGYRLSVLLITVGLIFGPLAVYFVTAPSRARFMYQRQKTLQHPLTYEWSEDGLAAIGAAGHWTIAWRDYHRFVSNERMLLFYQGPNIFQMLPTRALSNEQLSDIKRCAERISRGA